MDPFNVLITPHDHEYFIPLNIELDSDEISEFMSSSVMLGSLRKAMALPVLHYTGKVDDYFANTKKIVNELVGAIGVCVHQVSLFVAKGNSKIHRIHCDGFGRDGKPSMLEARLNFFNASPGHGIISWWEDTDLVLDEGPVVVDGDTVGYRYGYLSRWHVDKMPWDSIPEPIHSISTNIKSGFVRTNKPHTVFQGPQTRITISCMLVDKQTGLPTGIWERVRSYYG